MHVPLAAIGAVSLAGIVATALDERVILLDERIVTEGGERAMAQFYRNKYSFYHPILVTGDSVWRDYTVDLEFTRRADEGRSGAIVRY